MRDVDVDRRKSEKFAGGPAWRVIDRLPLVSACIFVCLLAAVLIFALPFAIPVQFHPSISASYMAGFNNRAASIAAAGISLTVAWWSWRRHELLPTSKSLDATRKKPISWLFLNAAIVLTCASTALAAWAIHRAGQRYIADAGYFIEQMSSRAEFGGTLYTQLEFAYGPLLFYPTVWLQRLLHCSMFTAYFLTLAVEQSVGLLELGCILSSLPVRTSLRRIAFVLFAVGAINPLLGLNYTLFRYLTPVALLVVIGRTKRPYLATIALAVCQVVSLGISAEMGFGFAAGSAALLLYKARGRDLRWLLALIGPAVGTVLFVVTVGRSYFHMLGAFAEGALNLPVAPYPHLLIFLFAVVWLAPLAVGRSLSVTDGTSDAIMACYGFSVAVLPSALGRCDPLHVFFVGAPFCLLSLATLSEATSFWRKTWSLFLFAFALWQIGMTNRLFRFRTADTLSQTLPPRISTALAGAVGEDGRLGSHLAPNGFPPYELEIPQLEEAAGGEKVATPFEITVQDEVALKRTHHFAPSYYAFMVDTFSDSAENKKIQEMNRSGWALVPAIYDRPFIETPLNLQDLQGISFPFPIRHPIPFLAGALLAANLRDCWVEVDELGPYRLLKRKPDKICAASRPLHLEGLRQ